MGKLLLVAIAVAGVMGEARSDEPYLGFSFSYVEPDSDRAADDGLGLSLLYGWQWRERLYPELTVHGANLDTGNDGGSDFYRWGAGADLRYELGQANWRPFVLGGIGVVRNDVVPNSLDSTDAYANAAVGLLSPELSYGLRLRAEARLFFDTFEDNQSDVHVGLGFQIPLGRTTKVVTVEQVEKIVYVERSDDTNSDSDNDGVLNAADSCPGTFAGAAVNASGCVIEQDIVLRGLNFEFDSAELKPASLTTLDNVVTTLRGEPNVVAEIAGHTDAVGSDSYNLRLSAARANAVRSYLMARGIEGDRISARGYGESEPVDTNATDAGRAANRRVEFRVRALPSRP